MGTQNLNMHWQKEVSNLKGYFDAAYMDNTFDRHSTIGYMFFYKSSLISWASKKQHTIALSTTEAEYLAGTEATKEAIWITSFLKGVGDPVNTTTQLLGDNQGANALAANPEYHARTKHIHGRQRFLSEIVEKAIIKVKYVPTRDMLADILTKPQPQEAYERFVNLIGLKTMEGAVNTRGAGKNQKKAMSDKNTVGRDQRESEKK